MQQLQPGAASGLVLRSKDSTEHGCWHDSMELRTTARAGRGTGKPLKELWLLSMSIKSKGKEIGGGSGERKLIVFLPWCAWGQGTPPLD